ncbi:hypothetical protein TNCV_4797381 [Trichonephila clavipes]|nr:hypothetical protein TNCV_4797381 [Trichonephila clavipes]
MSTEDMPRQGVFQQEEMAKTFPKSSIQLMKIVERPLTKFLRKPMFHGAQSSGFYPKFVRSEAFNLGPVKPQGSVEL